MKLPAKLALTAVLAGGLAALLLRQRPAPVEPSVSSSEAPDEETQLMTGAQRALAAGDTERAFSLLYEQATKFPKGKLADQRELTHVRALCRAGKPADAREEAASFTNRHPTSALAAEVKAACPPSR